MSKNIKKSHLLLWGFIPIFLLYGFVNFNEVITLDIYDALVVIATIHVMILLSVLFFINGFIYFYYWKNSISVGLKILFTLQIIVLLTSAGLLLLIPEFPENASLSNYLENGRSIKFYEITRKWSILGFLASQPLLVVNLIVLKLTRK
tara:strand:+ start:83570 stop:84013 length:444 start_codon:yes stop_codon:yes gene_type:complete